MTRICTICARAGSKGVPSKNLRPLGGKPLIAHSIEQAQHSKLFDVIAVTSDSASILEVAHQCGADITIVRPSELATDHAGKVPAIRHCLISAESATAKHFETIVDLDVTAPLRSVSDIVEAVRLLEEGGADNVVSGAPARHSPYFNIVELDAESRVGLSKRLDNPIVRRQDAPDCFDLNGAVYVWRRHALVHGPDVAIGANTALFVMPPDRSFDIDSEVDFLLVEALFERSLKPAPR